ncbi:hypothetical protein OAU99_01575 [Candidatus Poseidoniaceae archaeon]|nr:hypothetical protein [Candidatus Poseidoniaceae archaeon]
MQWKKLFDTRSTNPSNYSLIVSKAVDIKVKLEHEGYTIIGARGRVKKGTNWMQAPKVSLKGDSGTKRVDIPPPKNQKQNKALIALIYSLCHLSGAKQGANLFYGDNKGLSTSIATKHGPDKSEYMKGLISVLDDTDFITKLSSEISRPLPENLTHLEMDIISKSKEGILSAESVNLLLEKHNLDCNGLESAIQILRSNKEVELHRVPDKINWPKVSLPDHYGVVADKVNSALNAANAEIGDLKSKLEITKEKLSHTEEYNQALITRNLWARIRNKIKF